MSDLSDIDYSALDDNIVNSTNARQIVWHLINDIAHIPTCIECNNIVKWQRKNYASFCSAKCRANSESFKTAKNNTMIERYGHKHALQSELLKSKFKFTMTERYGHEHALQSELLKSKFKSTMLDRHDVEYAMQSDSLKYKAQQTTLEKYGVLNPAQADIIKQKTLQSNHARYNGHPSQQHISDLAKQILLDESQLTELLKHNSVLNVAKKLGVDQYTVYNHIKKYDIDFKFYCSNFETEIKAVLDNLNLTNIVFNDRNIIHPQELDFYLPDYNLAIECNGDYWHSDLFKSKDYHYNKWQKCKDQNITLLQISESTWHTQKEKIIELIKTHVHIKQKGIGARQCYISKIDAKSARKFLNKYHLQSFVISTSYWGAYDKQNNLIGVMTFGWTRGSRQSRRFELKRWATDNKTHPGLFSKTFAHAQKELKFNNVVSFSMNDWFTGDVYSQCKFTKGKTLPPSYQYLFNGELKHCSHFTKQQIKLKLPEHYNCILTEKEMMDNAGILRIWDSGKTEWNWTNDQNQKCNN